MLLLAIGLAALAFVLFLVTSEGNFSAHIAESGDVLAGGTLVLALVAEVVTVQAHAAASGLPDLKLQVGFAFPAPTGQCSYGLKLAPPI